MACWVTDGHGLEGLIQSTVACPQEWLLIHEQHVTPVDHLPSTPLLQISPMPYIAWSLYPPQAEFLREDINSALMDFKSGGNTQRKEVLRWDPGV